MNPVSRAACAGVLLSLGLGCADKPADFVRVEGNVVAVTGAPASAANAAPQRFAALRKWLQTLGAAPAIAQSSCGAAVEGVLACLATQGAGPTFGGTCARVRSNCEFEVDIELAAPGDSLFLFFCADADGNGTCEPTESSAPYLSFDKVGNFCNGDVIRVANISIDFASQTCTGQPGNLVADGCAPPDPTAPSGSTPTRRPGEPTSPPGATPTPAPGVTPPVPTVTLPPEVTPTAVPPTPVPTQQPPPQCIPRNGPCNATPQCCGTDLCFDGVCTACAQEGDSCGDPPLCCSATNSCQLGTCAPCGATGDGCAVDSDCCGIAFCDGGSCAPCLTLGDTGCGVTPCCSGQGVCFSDTCQFCSLTGTACAVSADCCAFDNGEDCNSGICSACADVGDFCSVDDDCCEKPNADLVCDLVSEECQPL